MSGKKRRSHYRLTDSAALATARGTDQARQFIERLSRKSTAQTLITPLLGSKLYCVQIVDRANLPIEKLTALERELPRFGTLLEFVLWGSARRPPVLLTETIALDEYAHDVIAPLRDGLTLVLEAT